MRFVTSVSSMIVLSLATLSLTSCGQSGIINAELDGKKTKDLKVINCSKILTGKDITLKIDNSYTDRRGLFIKVKPVTYDNVKIKVEKDTESYFGHTIVKYYTELEHKDGTDDSLRGKSYDSEKVIFDRYSVAKCFISADGKTKTLNLSGFSFYHQRIEHMLKHNDIVNSVKFSPNGQNVVTASEDTTAKIWNLKGDLVSNLTHQAGINYAEFSPDGQNVVTSSWDNTAKIWNLKGDLISTLRPEEQIKSAKFSPDGQKVMTISSDKTVKIWNIKGDFIATLPHSERIISA